MDLKTILSAVSRKTSLLYRIFRFPEQIWESIDSRSTVKLAPLWEAIANRPEIRLAPLIDPLTGLTYDYPMSQIRIKNDIANALASAIDYANSSRVPGDFAEFGIGSGWTSAVLARSQWPDQMRRLHLFDSFQGLPDAGPVDRDSPMVKSGVWGAGTCNWHLTPEILTRILMHESPSLDLSIYPGWFSEAMPNLPSDLNLALVHLDCDLYQSTSDVLNTLFERKLLSGGAILLFDDWTCNRCAPDLGQQRAWNESITKFSVRYLDYGFYSHSGKRFIYLGH